MDVKDRIKAHIDAHEELTVRNVSLKAGLSDSALHKFLTTSASMSIQNVEKVAAAMGVSMRWLMFGDEAEIIHLWDRVPPAQRDQAKTILETFADPGRAAK